MAIPGPSQARNMIRKSLLSLLGVRLRPTAVAAIWAFFDASCAYCGVLLDRKRREGHIDHLVSSKGGGDERLGNLVLACGTCNGDEKREMNWHAFLVQRCPDPVVREERNRRIEEWSRRNELGNVVADEDVVRRAEVQITRALVAYNAAVEKMRELRRGALR